MDRLAIKCESTLPPTRRTGVIGADVQRAQRKGVELESIRNSSHSVCQDNEANTVAISSCRMHELIL